MNRFLLGTVALAGLGLLVLSQPASAHDGWGGGYGWSNGYRGGVSVNIGIGRGYGGFSSYRYPSAGFGRYGYGYRNYGINPYSGHYHYHPTTIIDHGDHIHVNPGHYHYYPDWHHHH